MSGMYLISSKVLVHRVNVTRVRGRCDSLGPANCFDTARTHPQWDPTCPGASGIWMFSNDIVFYSPSNEENSIIPQGSPFPCSVAHVLWHSNCRAVRCHNIGLAGLLWLKRYNLTKKKQTNTAWKNDFIWKFLFAIRITFSQFHVELTNAW